MIEARIALCRLSVKLKLEITIKKDPEGLFNCEFSAERLHPARGAKALRH